MGRKKLHETQADRNAAFRETVRRIDLMLNPTLFDTIEKIAVHFNVPKNTVVNSLIRTALTQGDVFKNGLYQYK